MILSILFLILAVAAYSISQATQHNGVKWQNIERPYSFWGLMQYMRKYKNHDDEQGPDFFGSTTFLVWITDGYHLCQMLAMVFLSLSFGFLMGNHYYSLGAYIIVHIVHYFTYKFLSK